MQHLLTLEKGVRSLPVGRDFQRGVSDDGSVSLPPRPAPSDESPSRTSSKLLNVETAVKVVTRFRPPITSGELEDSNAFLVSPKGKTVETVDRSYCFELDRAFSEGNCQREVYEYVGRPIVEAVLNGYNGTVLTYGKSGSGKTYCMFGPSETVTLGEAVAPQLRGVVPRAVEQVFEHIASIDDTTEFTLRSSFLEVYREQFRDLLRPSYQKLQVKELPQFGLQIDGLSRMCVVSEEEVMSLLGAGCRARAAASTRQNQHSSRSHAIFLLHVEQRYPDGTECAAMLTLVDLAGSEKVSRSEAVGETLEEAKKINVSLTALGKVIDALAEQRPHVPYRDSKLTRVLQEALGGNCRTTMLVAASARSQHFDDTLSSLRFATRAKKVRNVAKVNSRYSSEQLMVMVAQLQRELAGAKRQISAKSHSLSPTKSREALLKFPVPSHEGKSFAHCNSASTGSLLSSASSVRPMNVKQGKSQSQEIEDDSLANLGQRVLADFDEMALLVARSHLSPRAVDPSRRAREVIVSDEAIDGHALDSPASEVNQAWKPAALAARSAVESLEAALLAQEAALMEAALIGPQAAARSADEKQRADAGGSGQLDAETMSLRFRALRHGVDAHSLRWRLQLERHRCEGLQLELAMQKRYSKELQRNLSGTSARLTTLLNEDSTFTNGGPSVPGAFTAPKGAHAGGGFGAAPLPQSARISRPIPHQVPAAFPEVCGSCSSSASRGSLISSIGAVPDTLPTDMTQSLSQDRVIRVAGTGDTGEKLGSESTEGNSMSLGDAEEQRQLVAELAASKRLAEEKNKALQAQLEELKVELSQCRGQRDLLATEIGSRDIKILALRHEVLVKDALLRHLRDAAVRDTVERDKEVELLLQEALAPLAVYLQREKAARLASVAKTAGEASATTGFTQLPPPRLAAP